ncbi:MAG: aminoglycoside phosphotransferase family protein [Candidatus Saccharibacteria bacterium]
MNKIEQKKIRNLANKLFDNTFTNINEEVGEQGNSGAAVHYFFGIGGGKPVKFVAKHATVLERQIFDLLKRQNQAIPKFIAGANTTGRDWMVMEHLDEIPYGDNESAIWAQKLGLALAKIHVANRGKCPSWLPTLDQKNPLGSVFADKWLPTYEKLMSDNAEFSRQFGSIFNRLKTSWDEFKQTVNQDLSNSSNLTLISTDLTPSHWRQRNGEPVLIDWEQARFGPIYFDLPNMLNDQTVKYYYSELVRLGWTIPEDEFAEKFSVLSRYLGFRYMTVGLDYWLDKLSENLAGNYWETVGEKFFHKCLDIAQNGYPKPIL